MPTDNTKKKKQDAEMADAYAQDRTADELDEYDAAKKRLTAGPVNDADLRYVSRYEGGNAGPIHAMPKQGDGTPVNLDDEQAVAAAPPPAPSPPSTGEAVKQAAIDAARYGPVGAVVAAARDNPQVVRDATAPVVGAVKRAAAAPGLFVGAVQDLRRRRRP